ncbi:LytR family transcriptional attenuator [Rudaeicoccus suwonensis]|uniref:LytR family transcriptional attenuator n=2 Tax=Rudaeicoccus suwonensis TaxID=657409 RepID=A0A561DVD4_9MICO|nr:LytR family transcriptional attenuator [Rudaeicoccus suwonensis]
MFRFPPYGPAMPTQRRRPRFLKAFLISLGTIVCVIVLAVGGLFLYLQYGLSHNITKASLLPDEPGSVTRNPVAGNAQNILLIGSDTRSGTIDNLQGNSDVIQLVHISNGDKKISVIDFPRDLYVAIPGYPMNKINWSYARGGAPLLVETLQNLLGVHIDHVAQIDFTGFADLTNDLGGVEVYVPQGYSEGGISAGTQNPIGFGSWTKGWHHMNGDQALGFVRERHQLTLGDIDRGVDEQEWIHAIVKKMLTPSVLLNPVKLVQATNDLTKNATVDQTMTVSYLDNLAVNLAQLNPSDVSYYTAPWSGFATNVDGDVDTVNMPQMKLLGQALNQDKMASYTYDEHAMQ